MKKVVKFGGSSLANAEQFKKVGHIIRSDAGRRYVVPSAPGKRFPADIKVTDMLYSCYGEALLEDEDLDFTVQLDQIKKAFRVFHLQGRPENYRKKLPGHKGL